MLVVGVPLVGKTTLTERLVAKLDAETLHVENDRLRSLVVDAMDREGPAFDDAEKHATYEAARRLIERGLTEGLHVVHDATNLREADRRRSYGVADELEAPVRVAFVDAPQGVLEQRARREGAGAERALAALGDREAAPSANTRPHLVLDGTRPPEANVDLLLADEVFASLRRTAEA